MPYFCRSQILQLNQRNARHTDSLLKATTHSHQSRSTTCMAKPVALHTATDLSEIFRRAAPAHLATTASRAVVSKVSGTNIWSSRSGSGPQVASTVTPNNASFVPDLGISMPLLERTCLDSISSSTPLVPDDAVSCPSASLLPSYGKAPPFEQQRFNKMKACAKDENDGSKKTFPELLMRILDLDEVQDVICWLPSGKSFSILNPKEFATRVLPKYFRQTKFTSFARKLNRWGFRQALKGSDHGAYHHKFFQKENPILCLKMSCRKNRGPGFKATKSSPLKNSKNNRAATKTIMPCVSPQPRPTLALTYEENTQEGLTTEERNSLSSEAARALVEFAAIEVRCPAYDHTPLPPVKSLMARACNQTGIILEVVNEVGYMEYSEKTSSWNPARAGWQTTISELNLKRKTQWVNSACLTSITEDTA